VAKKAQTADTQHPIDTSATGEAQVMTLKEAELKKMLQDRGRSTEGLKADLIERLKAAIESSGVDSSNAVLKV